MNIAIIYHDADFDGILSNAACRHWLERLRPNAVVHSYGWDYGRPLPKLAADFGGSTDPWSAYDTIYIVDLSVDELMCRWDLRNKIVWIDHHKSAIDKYGGFVEQASPLEGAQKIGFKGYRIDGVAACRLCWQWFLREKDEIDDDVGFQPQRKLPTKQDFIDRTVREPELIRLAGEYDVWDHRDPDGKALQFGLRAMKPGGFDELVHYQFACGPAEQINRLYLQPVIANGHAIKAYCDKQNAEYAAKYSHTIQWRGMTWCALNIGQKGNSDLLAGGIEPDHEALFAWRYCPDGDKPVYVSLYHAPGKTDHDLSVIAKSLGGGGHKGACGFRTTLAALDCILNGGLDNFGD